MLDTRGLTIHGVHDKDQGVELPFQLGAKHVAFGAPLTIDVSLLTAAK